MIEALKRRMRPVRFSTLVALVSFALLVLFIGLLVLFFYHDTISYMKTQGYSTQVTKLTLLTNQADRLISDAENVMEICLTDDQLVRNVQAYFARQSPIRTLMTLDEDIRQALEGRLASSGIIEYIAAVDDRGAIGSGENIPYAITVQTLLSCFGLVPESFGPGVRFSILRQDYRIGTNGMLRKDCIYFIGRLGEGQYLLAKLRDNWYESLSAQTGLALLSEDRFLWNLQLVGDAREIAARIGDMSSGDIRPGGAEGSRLFFRRLSQGTIVLVMEENVSGVRERLLRLNLVTCAALMGCVLLTLLASRLFLRRTFEPLDALTEMVHSYQSDRPAPPPPKRRVWNISLRARLTLYMIVTVAIPAGLFILAYNISLGYTIQDELRLSRQSTYQQAAGSVEMYLARGNTLMQAIGMDLTLHSLLRKGADAEAGIHARRLANDAFRLWGMDMDMALYAGDWTLLYDTTMFSWDQAALETGTAKGGMDWIGPGVSRAGQETYRMAYVIKDFVERDGRQVYETVGYLLYAFSEEMLSWQYRDVQLLSPQQMYITDGDGTIVSAVNKQLLGTASAPEPGGYAYPIPQTPFVFHVVQLENDIRESMQALMSGKVYLAAVFCLALMLVINALVGLALHPLTRLRKRISASDLIDLTEIARSDSVIHEVAELEHAFNDLKARNDRLIDDLVRAKIKESSLENEKHQAELYALQSQIRPHFLCNLLESIRCLIKIGDLDNANAMIGNMGNLFRYSISGGRALVPVREELNYTMAYCEIMRFHYGNDLRFEWLVAEAAYDACILRMLLQPLIENALKHGIAPKGGKGSVCINVARGADFLKIEIRDDGAGMSADRLNEVTLGGSSGGPGGVGLANVKKRLKLYYGAKASLQIESGLGAGTRLLLIIPIVPLHPKENACSGGNEL